MFKLYPPFTLLTRNQAKTTSHSITAVQRYPLLVFIKKYYNEKQIESPLQLDLNPKYSWLWRTWFNWFQGSLFGGWGCGDLYRACVSPVMRTSPSTVTCRLLTPLWTWSHGVPRRFECWRQDQLGVPSRHTQENCFWFKLNLKTLQSGKGNFP